MYRRSVYAFRCGALAVNDRFEFYGRWSASRSTFLQVGLACTVLQLGSATLKLNSASECQVWPVALQNEGQTSDSRGVACCWVLVSPGITVSRLYVAECICSDQRSGNDR